MAEETIISDLEQAPLLTDDMVIAVEDTKNTYSATLAQLRELVNKLFVEKEDIDFNTLTDDGFYQVGGTLTNAPVSGSITWIVQVVKVGTVIVQNAMATDATNYVRQFVRRYNGTSWEAWVVVGGKIIQSLTSSTTDVPCSKAVNDGLAKKQATITGGASTIVSNNLTASRALVSDRSGKVAVSAVTSTEIGYLDGVTSNLQTQLNERAKTDLSNVSTSGKEASVGWGIPDYSAGVSKTNDTQYTAETDGLLWIRLDDYNGSSSLVIDGKTFTINLSGSNQVQISNLPLFIGKGSKYKVIFGRTSSNTSITFFPCKGVN